MVSITKDRVEELKYAAHCIDERQRGRIALSPSDNSPIAPCYLNLCKGYNT